MKNNENKIYIKTDRNFYFSGDTISGKIFIDITELINSKGVQLTIKGKEILQSNLESNNSDSSSSENEDEEDYEKKDKNNNNNITNSSSNIMFKTTKSTSSYQPPKFNNNNKNSSIKNSINDNNNNNELNYNDDIEIFKSKTFIPVSLNNYIKQGKYILPFESKLPNNIPGTFLLNTSNIFCEIFYTIKAKLINSNNDILKCSIPIIIREKENNFNYKNTMKKINDIGNCGCGKGTTKIEASFPLGFINIGKTFQIKVNIDNKKCDVDGSNILINVYQKIILHPNKKDKKEIYNEISYYETENKIKANEEFNDLITFNNNCKFNSIKNLDIKSYMFKLFPEKNKLLNLYSTVKSEIIQCEYEFSITVTYTSWNVDEINLIIPVILYPNDNIFKNIDSSILSDFNNAVTKDKTIINIEKNEIKINKNLNEINETQDENENSSSGSYEEEEEEEDENNEFEFEIVDLIIKIELVKNNKKKYYFLFKKKSGDYEQFLTKTEKLKKLIKNYIINNY